VNIASSNIGNGKEVALRVLDEREDSGIGKRGTGMIQGARITTEEDIVQLFSDQITEGLKQNSFNVIPYSDQAPVILKVEIRNLDYDSSAGFWTIGNVAKSSLKVLVSANGKTYEKMYRSEEEIRTAFVASQKTNSKIINSSVSQVLGEMFADEELLKFLAQ
jgi:uncharacterized lipoprotein YajG